jgi:hypothetical protein
LPGNKLVARIFWLVDHRWIPAIRDDWRNIPWLLKKSSFLPNSQNLADAKCLES